MIRITVALLALALGGGSADAQAPGADPLPPPAAAPSGAGEAPLPPAPATTRLEDLLKPTFRVRGLIETEAVAAAQSAQSKADIGDIQNGYGFRRIRLGVQGGIGDTAKWVSEVELAGGDVQLLDVFVGLTAVPGVRELRIGRFREPFSLEGMTSVNYLTLLERSPLNPLDPARNWGVCGYWWPDSERYTVSAGVFRNGTNQTGNSIGDQDAWAYTGRVTGLPVYEPEDAAFRLLHLGGAFSTRNPFDGLVVFNPGRAPSLLAVVDNPDSPFLPAVQIPASSQQIYNLQAASVAGPCSLQGEFFATTIDQIGAGNVFLYGFYSQVSYFLTGEHRGYDRTRGAFSQANVLRPLVGGRAGPGSGFGAVEVAARYSYYNFSSPNLPPTPEGASSRAILNQIELGVNWYLNNNTRLMFNYTLPFVDRLGVGSTAVNVFGLRAALFW